MKSQARLYLVTFAIVFLTTHFPKIITANESIKYNQPPSSSTTDQQLPEQNGSQSQSLHTILVGGFAGTITILQFDEKTQKLSKLNSLNNSFVGASPSWMKISPDGQFLHSANEVKEIDHRKNTGSLSSYRLLNNDSKPNSNRSLVIEPMNQAFTSADPVSFDISTDQKNMIVASYTGATACRYELNDDRSFKSTKSAQTFTYNASGPITARQSQSHLHQARYDPTGRIAAFVDLGGDRVYLHSVDKQTGELNPIHTIQLEPGTGPRHLTFFTVNESRTDVYLICELSNKMIYIQLNHITKPTISIKLQQILNTLPTEFQTQTTFGAGEVVISNDGKFLYGTNRQTDFKRPKEENNLDQSFLVVVGQQDHLVGIYKRDVLNGEIKFLDMITIDEPAYVEFL
ncbi:uncharacterized protein MELLADRAFT_106898 [Melampsora larici-populina 98AG31]|uniref:3-carboxymuconate cyclase n=1 Tax=Melampsora larici-populina (strain 98AG31 / pathotype 3-4-7) TaxID=747676 RepID=F4RN02_MELLP|nr:uncharacterized protein MELLADRAFT_106898 [Melampsora larici-populina 98AG31]EGG06212.1 hypothetical protein MELLADRAFT_106898 [Melampsora larici-populina 98AG31]